MASRPPSIESYLERNPCIMQTAADAFYSRPYLFPTSVLSLILLCSLLSTRSLLALAFSPLTVAATHAAILITTCLYMVLCVRSPGMSLIVHSENSLKLLLRSLSSHLASDEPMAGHTHEYHRSWSYCGECVGYRPARAHHCRQCKRCVLMADHHCLLINNCVGASNIFQFLLFNLFLFLTSVFLFIVNWLTIFSPIDGAHAEHLTATLAIFLVQFMITASGACASFYLLFRTLYLVSNNATGIELIKKRALLAGSAKPKRKIEKFFYPFEFTNEEKDLEDGGQVSVSIPAPIPSSVPSSVSPMPSNYSCVTTSEEENARLLASSAIQSLGLRQVSINNMSQWANELSAPSSSAGSRVTAHHTAVPPLPEYYHYTVTGAIRENITNYWIDRNIDMKFFQVTKQ